MKILRWCGFAVLMIVVAFFVRGWVWEHSSIVSGADGNIIINGSFEESGAGTPAGWNLEKKVAHKGRADVVSDYAHSGRFSLKLSPNGNNQPSGIGNNPFGLGQAFPGSGVRGKKFYVSAWMHAEGGATAILGAYVVLRSGGLVPTEVRQSSGEQGPVQRHDIAVVPNRSDVLALVIGCIVEGTSGAAYFDDVRVSMDSPSAPPATTTTASQPSNLTATITVAADQEIRRIPREVYGTNLEWIWDGNGIWDATRRGFQPEILRLSRELATTLYRFPGGMFADFYHWKDGIGPQESRPERPHIPGGPKSVHRFGTDEALAFAEQAGGKLMITVNIITGTPQEAAEWIRYANRQTLNTGSKPRVEFWEVGNESYVTGDMGAQKAALLTPSRYAARFLEFARAMRAADPSIKIGAIGDENFGTVAPLRRPNWTEELLRTAGQEIDFLALHNAYSPGIFIDKGWDVRTVYRAMLASPELIRKSLDEVSRKIEQIAPARAGKIRIAVTEWGPLFQAEPNGRLLDHVKTLGSGLFVASTLKVFLENPLVEIANFFKLVDSLWMGWIGPRGGAYLPKGPYFALQMFTVHFGSELVRSTATSPGFDNPSDVGTVSVVSGAPYLDVVASRSSDRRIVYVLAINKHLDRPILARITLHGFKPAGAGTAWVLNGTGTDANTGTELFKAPGITWAKQAMVEPNPRFDRGGPDEIRITSAPLQRVAGEFEYTFAPHSVTSLEINSR
jgi:alpha-L-arabinofuranosidase